MALGEDSERLCVDCSFVKLKTRWSTVLLPHAASQKNKRSWFLVFGSLLAWKEDRSFVLLYHIFFVLCFGMGLWLKRGWGLSSLLRAQWDSMSFMSWDSIHYTNSCNCFQRPISRPSTLHGYYIVLFLHSSSFLIFISDSSCPVRQKCQKEFLLSQRVSVSSSGIVVKDLLPSILDSVSVVGPSPSPTTKLFHNYFISFCLYLFTQVVIIISASSSLACACLSLWRFEDVLFILLLLIFSPGS